MQPDLLEDENPEMYDRGEGAHLLNGNENFYLFKGLFYRSPDVKCMFY